MPSSLFVVLNLEMSIQYQALLLCNLRGLKDTHKPGSSLLLVMFSADNNGSDHTWPSFFQVFY